MLRTSTDTPLYWKGILAYSKKKGDFIFPQLFGTIALFRGSPVKLEGSPRGKLFPPLSAGRLVDNVVENVVLN